MQETFILHNETEILGIPSLQKLTLLAEVIYQTKNKPNNLYLS